MQSFRMPTPVCTKRSTSSDFPRTHFLAKTVRYVVGEYVIAESCAKGGTLYFNGYSCTCFNRACCNVHVPFPILRARVSLWRARVDRFAVRVQLNNLYKSWAAARRRVYLDDGYQDVPIWASRIRGAVAFGARWRAILLYLPYLSAHHLHRHRDDYAGLKRPRRPSCIPDARARWAEQSRPTIAAHSSISAAHSHPTGTRRQHALE